MVCLTGCQCSAGRPIDSSAAVMVPSSATILHPLETDLGGPCVERHPSPVGRCQPEFNEHPTAETDAPLAHGSPLLASDDPSYWCNLVSEGKVSQVLIHPFGENDQIDVAAHAWAAVGVRPDDHNYGLIGLTVRPLRGASHDFIDRTSARMEPGTHEQVASRRVGHVRTCRCRRGSVRSSA